MEMLEPIPNQQQKMLPQRISKQNNHSLIYFPASSSSPLQVLKAFSLVIGEKDNFSTSPSVGQHRTKH